MKSRFRSTFAVFFALISIPIAANANPPILLKAPRAPSSFAHYSPFDLRPVGLPSEYEASNRVVVAQNEQIKDESKGTEVPGPKRKPLSWEERQKLFANDLFVLIILVLVGGVGGYLSATSNMPRPSADFQERRLKNRRWIRDHLIKGAAGAIIIVTLSPVDQNIVNFIDQIEPIFLIKLVALGLIGGYAGGSLLETSAAQWVSRKFEEMEEQTKYLKASQKHNETSLRHFEERLEKDRRALRLVEEILRGLMPAKFQIEEFSQLLNDISPGVRFDIAYRANDHRRQHWEKEKDIMERSLIVFRALVGTEEPAFWWYGALGYCLKDKDNPDFEGAVRCFDMAVEKRGGEATSGSYEFNRALCNIKLAFEGKRSNSDEALITKIRNDLMAARRFRRYRDIIDNEPSVQDWLRKHGLKPQVTPS